MKRVLILLLTLAIIVLNISIVQAEDPYASLKDEYLQNHPGQSLIPYPWNPITSTKVLPFSEIPAAPANNISISACRDEFESASFIINARKDLSGVTISVPNLYSAQGDRIASDAINVRTVKVWHQAGEGDIRYKTAESVLTPELLLKDDTLVSVDYINKTNFLKVTINGNEQYIDISNPNTTFPSNAQVRDAQTLQPFSLKANENKQIWLTVHVPENTPAGDYYGDITITAPSEIPVSMNFSVRVLPFTLELASLKYGLYYIAVLPLTDPTTLTSGYKSSNQMLIELQDMKDHGVSYPTLYQPDDAKLDTALTLRNSVRFPQDSIYLGPNTPHIGNATDPAGLATIADSVINWKNHTESWGYQKTYFYGMDEATGSILNSQRPAWQTVHNNGGKMYVAGSDYELIKMADILDTGVTAYALNSTQVPLWHGYGHTVFSYNNPQVGVENPEIYRRNYGFALWNAGYDGAMDYAYQHGYGQSIWNDFDSPITKWGDHVRDHVFAYPTSNGVIDTIQWEGWREGVDDTRYLATLIKTKGSNTSAKSLVSDSLSKNENMGATREKVIGQILSYSTLLTANFTVSPNSGTSPLTVMFSDTSTGFPTSWNWSYTSSNLLFYSQNFDNRPSWYLHKARLEAADVPAPDGTWTAFKLIDDNIYAPHGKNDHFVSQIVYPEFNTTYTFSAYLKPAGDAFADLTIMGYSYAWRDGFFDLVNGTKAGVSGFPEHSGDDLVLGITPAGNGWYRCSVTFNSSYGNVTQPTFDIFTSKGGSTDPINIDFTGDNKTGIYIWGAQLEKGSIATPYVQTYAGNRVYFSTLQNPSYTFYIPGNYTVFLTSTNSNECNTTPNEKWINISSRSTISATPTIGVFRKSSGNWYLETTKTGTVNKTFHFGTTGDVPVTGDWNNDGTSDVGVFRPSNGNWYLETTKTGAVDTSFRFGKTGDIPITGDWNNDGIADVGVFRPSSGYWYLETAKTGAVYRSFLFGKSGDIPVTGDWNNDGIADVGVFRPSNGYWYLENAKTGAVDQSFRFGKTGDVPVTGDWNNDGISDIGVFRPSSGYWYLETAKTGAVDRSFGFGKTGDIPVIGDWNGDGTSDVGVFRPSSGYWYLETTKTGAVSQAFHFGTNGDTPVVGAWN